MRFIFLYSKNMDVNVCSPSLDMNLSQFNISCTLTTYFPNMAQLTYVQIKEMCSLILMKAYLSVLAAVIIIVFNAYLSKALANGSCRLISSKNTLSRCYNCMGNLGQLFLQCGWRVVEVSGHFAHWVLQKKVWKDKIFNS